MHGRITEDWADGVYSFRLGYGEWQELDALLKVGPITILRGLLDPFEARFNWPREVIRLGLIGGGTDTITALRLVRRYVDEAPLVISVHLARRIVEASIYVPEGQSVGEAKAVRTTDESTSEPPTATLQ